MVERSEAAMDSSLQSFAEDDPSAPWRVKEAWKGGTVRCLNDGAMIAMWMIAILWLGIATPLNLDGLDNLINRGILSHEVGLVFVALGLVLSSVAVRFTIRWIKFGRSTFEIRNGTGRIGGVLAGTIRCSRELTATGDHTMKLSCIGGSLGGCWSQELILPAAYSLWSGIPVSFEIPPNCNPSRDRSKKEGRVFWNLRIKTPVDGIDYVAEFEVPVHRVR